MARPKLTPDERKLRGDAGKRTRTRKSKPDVQAAPQRYVPDAPAWLTDAHALSEWQRLAPELSAMRVLTELDVNNLAQYCMWFAVMLQAQDDIAADGIVTTSKSKHGELKRKNPALGALKDASREMKAVGDALGIGPMSRFKLGSAAANNGQQLMLPGFDAAIASAVNKKATQTDGSLTQAKDEAADYFGYH